MRAQIYFCGSCWALKTPGYTQYFGTWLQAVDGLEEAKRISEINNCLHQTKDRMGQVNVEVLC